MVDLQKSIGVARMNLRMLLRSAKQAAFLAVIAGVVASGSLYMLGYMDMARGLGWGILGSVGYFGLLWFQLSRNWEAEPTEAVAEIQSGWMERMAYMAVICGVAWFIPGVHLAGVLIGLLCLHFVVFGWALIILAKDAKKTD